MRMSVVFFRMGFVSGLGRKKTIKTRIISSVTGSFSMLFHNCRKFSSGSCMYKFHLTLIFFPLIVDTPVNTSPEKVQLPKGDTWSVHKFGGTCMGNSERIKNVAKIILSDDSERKFVVVSAMSKVTDMMYDLINKAQSGDESYISALDAVLEKHRSTALDLIDGDDLCSFLAQLQHDISNLKAMLRAIYIGTRLLSLTHCRSQVVPGMLCGHSWFIYYFHKTSEH